MECRFCKHKVETEFADLVNSPASNSYLTKEQLGEMVLKEERTIKKQEVKMQIKLIIVRVRIINWVG